ncbi:hypothetical protein [Brasilonema bromeliae]|uniref:hypothetical protein n=1 Tax=Brasilonema bromeliae TaxID=383615 RepID=UPI00145D44FD|nr:hypothetical protein [Brasilonema bromeliae]
MILRAMLFLLQDISKLGFSESYCQMQKVFFTNGVSKINSQKSHCGFSSQAKCFSLLFVTHKIEPCIHLPPSGYAQSARLTANASRLLSGERQMLYLGRPQDRTGSPPAALDSPGGT